MFKFIRNKLLDRKIMKLSVDIGLLDSVNAVVLDDLYRLRCLEYKRKDWDTPKPLFIDNNFNRQNWCDEYVFRALGYRYMCNENINFKKMPEDEFNSKLSIDYNIGYDSGDNDITFKLLESNETVVIRYYKNRGCTSAIELNGKLINREDYIRVCNKVLDITGYFITYALDV